MGGEDHFTAGKSAVLHYITSSVYVGAGSQYITSVVVSPLEFVRVSVCVFECVVGVVSVDAIYTPSGTEASCHNVLGGGMLRTFIYTYCPKGIFSVCF